MMSRRSSYPERNEQLQISKRKTQTWSSNEHDGWESYI